MTKISPQIEQTTLSASSSPMASVGKRMRGQAIVELETDSAIAPTGDNMFAPPVSMPSKSRGGAKRKYADQQSTNSGTAKKSKRLKEKFHI